MAGFDLKLNKSDTLYHTIRGFVNTKQGEDESNNNSKLRFDKFCKTMDLDSGVNILLSK